MRSDFSVVLGSGLRFVVWSGAVLSVLGYSGCGKDRDKGPVTAQTSSYKVADDESAPPKPAADSGATAIKITDPAAETEPPSQPGLPPEKLPPEVTPKPADSGASGATTVPDPPTMPPLLSRPKPKSSGKTVPEGREALVKFLQDSRNQQPQTEDEFRQLLDSRLAAADKLEKLATEKEDRVLAAVTKLETLQLLAQGGPEAEKNLHAYVFALVKDKDPDVARLARLFRFELGLNDLATGKATDAQAVFDELQKLVTDDGKDPRVFIVTSRAVSVLQELGHKDIALQACQLIAKTYQNHSDPRLAGAARDLLVQARVLELDVSAKVEALLKGQPDSLAPVQEALKALLTGGEGGAGVLGTGSQLAQLIEVSHNYEAAGQAYDQLEQVFATNADKQLATQATAAADRGRRRLALLGKPFTVVGQLADGTPFDWTKYSGKPVLVAFWSASSRQCMSEMASLLRIYTRYREQGFEIVGVNLDERVTEVQQFLEQQPLPWKNVFSADPKARGAKSPLAVKCGVEELPFLVLVERDGKVKDLHVHSAELERRLAAQFGPDSPEKKFVPAKPDSTKPDPAKPQAKPDAPQEPAETPDAPQSRRAAHRAEYFVAAQEPPLPAAADPPPAANDNPYLPDAGLSPSELVDFIMTMQDKPKSIQARPGFAEALVVAADRLLAAEVPEKQRTVAALTKFEILHKLASFGDAQADQRLRQFADQLKDNPQPQIAREVKFLLIERRAVDADQVPLAEVPKLLEDVKAYVAQAELTARYLRLASATVHAINRLEDADQREKWFETFGNLFAKSPAKELAQYGKKLAKKPEVELASLVGKPLELSGVTEMGAEFQWAQYRDKVVLVDFWASWCGPCRQELPHVKALYERLKARGFEVVGVNLDRDKEALAKYLQENALPWANLVGEDASQLATKYGIRGIPAMILIDRSGKVVATGNKVEGLAARAEELLGAKN